MDLSRGSRGEGIHRDCQVRGGSVSPVLKARVPNKVTKTISHTSDPHYSGKFAANLKGFKCSKSRSMD